MCVSIAEKVLSGSGRTQLTIISFGMGDHVFAEGIVSVAELQKNKPKPKISADL
jgi:hypothetical protein